ncbi:phosphoglycerate kinase [Corynebacterium jeikeium]|jgi:phosphoglycerate kinase|uniref:Phosphoglycerate kinase n=1 Tax=Corynebacterium jeikeium (strain K411) TaxID=306537 RepID=PGK_CORJK|nr:phosphoglycerate kinase [Corynebacterium jeikeium]Q4JVJ3.1 RecName: Full=Phosphoglycerate kinase [Corynebacterium jeikeium K411]EEW16340.1 phosphoglycerate kinase [Corynebacterium jeikeium ATCC 43734]OOD34046.1 phosphoglycerate kinase [Corynebacterium jeikeium]WCZ53553.1 Phosphoglycerate kinase [Corynebacterium jeikeium]CAI37164.1 phosphoglycerate kinase [Corynebacterium jeikeium K411]SQI21324.1 phosphoglycerate kinase [Corynebacterium jeikeium]
MAIKTVQDLINEGVQGRHVLVRADLNVPLSDGNITDPGRIDASVPTLKALLEAGARVVVSAHLGRPKGEFKEEFSLAPVAEALAERLDQWVPLATDVTGEDAHERANGLDDGDILLLENVRFDARETSKDETERTEFAAELAALTGDNGAFVSDGFGVVHRKQASVYDVAKKLPHYAGGLVEAELNVLRKVSEAPEKPYAVVLGGSKVSDKLGVIEALAPRVDNLIIGGGMCFTFLAAKGYEVGGSLLQEDMIDTCKDLLERFGDVIALPTDVVVAERFDKDADHRTVDLNSIPEGWMGLDIGPESVKAFAEVLSKSKTVFWNGPMGVFEFPAFAEGTRGVAQAIIDATAAGAFSVVGGGDSAAAVRTLGLNEEGFSHISTGGGASLEFLEGKELPGVSVLES